VGTWGTGTYWGDLKLNYAFRELSINDLERVKKLW